VYGEKESGIIDGASLLKSTVQVRFFIGAYEWVGWGAEISAGLYT